jgi:hypothetical protein
MRIYLQNKELYGQTRKTQRPISTTPLDSSLPVSDIIGS